MLAKLWKKLLFAICIIACIYNVMNKLVSRTSLEVQLKNVELNPLTNENVYESKNNYKSSKIYREEEDNDAEESEDDFIIVFDE